MPPFFVVFSFLKARLDCCMDFSQILCYSVRMGTYLNPDNAPFLQQVEDIYIDKTMLIKETNKVLNRPTFKFVCVSRPRRFGKTIAGNMLSAYYSKGADSRDLFAPFKIATDPSFEQHLNKYNVLKLDLNAMYSKWLSFEPKEERSATVIGYMTNLVIEDFKKNSAMSILKN